MGLLVLWTLSLSLTACQNKPVTVYWCPTKVTFHKETKDWLKAAAEKSPPPPEFSTDFDNIGKQQKKIDELCPPNKISE